MSNFCENFGLDILMKDDASVNDLLGFILEEGKMIPSYSGYPYYFKSFGKPEFFARMRVDKEKRNVTVEGLDSHCTGNCVWEMVHGGMDLSPEHGTGLNRTIMLRRPEEDGLVPVELITADVYPSFLKGDKYKIQVVGLPLSISYYSDEEAYWNALTKDEEGERWGVADGALIASGFLYNHAPEQKEEFDPETDKNIIFKGKVKRIIWGSVNDVKGEAHDLFIRTFIDTMYGELELDHTLEQMDEDQLENLKVGAVVSGVCVLSGDLAIDEYENGIIKDHEHDLMLLRYTFEKGEEERLRSVLKEDASYISETTGKQFSGADEIISQIRYVIDNRNCDIVTKLATITETEEGMEYDSGTRCFIIAYGKNKPFEAIVFIDVDEEGMISRIKISKDSRYHFKTDAEYESHFFDDMELPDTVEEAMLLRAKATKRIRPMEESYEEFRALTGEKERYLERAKKLWEKAGDFIVNGPQEKTEMLFGNLFTRAFEERLLSETAVEPMGSDAELISGERNSLLSSAWEELVHRAEKHGKTYCRDFENYRVTAEDAVALKELFVNSAVMLQEIGEAYAVKHKTDHMIGSEDGKPKPEGE